MDSSLDDLSLQIFHLELKRKILVGTQIDFSTSTSSDFEDAARRHLAKQMELFEMDRVIIGLLERLIEISKTKQKRPSLVQATKRIAKLNQLLAILESMAYVVLVRLKLKELLMVRNRMVDREQYIVELEYQLEALKENRSEKAAATFRQMALQLIDASHTVDKKLGDSIYSYNKAQMESIYRRMDDVRFELLYLKTSNL